MKGPDTPRLDELLSLFPLAEYLHAFEYVAADDIPPPFHDLLVHPHHMTVTVEAYHGDLVDVRVLDHRLDRDAYSRKILLTLQKSGKVVQFGLVRVHLNFCSQQVRDEILARQTPLGRILIRHDVLRRIEPTGYLRVAPGPDMRKWFGLEAPKPTYGRLAMIYCDGLPAIELLEIVAPD